VSPVWGDKRTRNLLVKKILWVGRWDANG
jgi:hypothetical protein